MKYNPNKSYGYPVQRQALTEFEKANADYVDEFFDPQFNESKSFENKDEMQIEIQMFGINQAIKDAIGKTQAEISVIVQCRDTFFSHKQTIEHKDASSNLYQDIMNINANNLYGEVTIRAVIVATKDFILKSEKINAEFGFKEFEVTKGMLLAESATARTFVHKEPINSPQSIVSLHTTPKFKDGEYDVSLESDYIQINISPELNKKMAPLKNTKEGRELSFNVLFVPAISYALTMLKAQPDEYTELKWAQSLTNALDDLKKNNDVRDEPHNQAQALFRNTILNVLQGEK